MKPWTSATGGTLDMEEFIDTTPHVYAVAADGSLIDYNSADATATGVALVAGVHKFMIAKSDARNDNVYWGEKLYNKDVPGIDNKTREQGIEDFKGKENTAAIIAAYGNFNVNIGISDMCSVLNTFNQAEKAEGRSYDWYVPACGQLALIFSNITEINAALEKISGTTFQTNYYWSSSENSREYGLLVSSTKGNVNNFEKLYPYPVRFIRDI